MKTTSTLLALLALASTSSLSAQETDFVGAVLYEHGNYGGSTLTLYPGEGIPYLSDYWESTWETWNDQISSLAVWGNVVVYLYSDVNYRGEVIEIRDHVERLGAYGWNDLASSVWVDWAEPEGWYWDTTFRTWMWREADGWLYHNDGIGWVYGYYYDALEFSGWIWDSRRGWLWTGPSAQTWLVDSAGNYFFHYPGTHNPRWWYSDATGWFSD